MEYEKADGLQNPFKMGFGIISAFYISFNRSSPVPFGCPLWENEAVKASYDALDLFRPLFPVSRDPLKHLL